MPHTAVSYRSIDAGVPGLSAVAPEVWWLDSVLLQRPGNAEIQLALMVEYASNVALS